MGSVGWRWLVLATARSFDQSRMAALLRQWTLDQFGLRLVLAIGLFMGVGTVPLWAMAITSSLWLGLDTGHSVGTGMGDLAQFRRLLRMGARPAACCVRRWIRMEV